jgi:hypothetical protein
MQRRSDGHPLLSWLKKTAGEYACNRQPEHLHLLITSFSAQRKRWGNRCTPIPSLSRRRHTPPVSITHAWNKRKKTAGSFPWLMSKGHRSRPFNLLAATSRRLIFSFSVTHEHSHSPQSLDRAGRSGRPRMQVGTPTTLCVFFSFLQCSVISMPQKREKRA